MTTGIPPHVGTIGKLKTIFMLREEREERKSFLSEVKEAISGQVSRPVVEGIFYDFGEKLETKLSEKID